MFASLLQEVGSAVSLSQSSESLLQVLGEVGSSGILLTGGSPPARQWSGRQGLGKAPIPVRPAYTGCCVHSGSGVSRCPCPGMQSGDRQWLCQQSAWVPGLPHSHLTIRPSPCR